MRLFPPQFISCPICYGQTTGRTGYVVSAFEDLGNGRYRGTSQTNCDHEFSLYESLKTTIGEDQFGIAKVFSHNQWHEIVPVTPGDFARIPIPMIADHRPFLAVAGAYGQPMGIEATIVDDLSLVVATTRVPISDGAAAEEPRLSVVVFFHRSFGSEAWPLLLYEAIADCFHHRHQLAIFKLATCVEIYADRLFERYLVETADVSAEVATRILRQARSWRARFDRVGDVIGLRLGSDSYTRYSRAGGPFTNDVRVPRNEFAHGMSRGWALDAALRAFRAAFDVIWTYADLDTELSPVR